VAVLGGGPAGLGCAAELALLGHSVVVFEKKPQAGGLNTHGIAYYKMKPELSLQEVELIRSLGVEIRCGVEVGKEISTAQLDEDFDAIFLGIGLGNGGRLEIPGEDLPEVIDALHFIEQLHTRSLHTVPVGERVAVIGCGNTAIDAVTQAKRLGAQRAAIIYRRGEADMSAYHFEYELAKKDGAIFFFDTVPLEVMADAQGHVCALRLARTRAEPDGKVKVIPGSEWLEPFDMVLKAVGQQKQTAAIKKLFPALQCDDSGVILRHPATSQTNLTKIFAGGDCANGGREVVNAVAEGKKAARGIHAFLSGQSIVGPVQPSRWGVKGPPVGSGFDAPIRVNELGNA
jgi:glutamate synthase (NADPH/NADH) small chain